MKKESPWFLSALTKQLECAPKAVTLCGGGDINQLYRVDLSDGRRFALKTRAQAPARMFECEAKGLRWLQDTQEVSTPDVLGFVDSHENQPSGYLLLEWIESRERCHEFDEMLGRQLGRLHQNHRPRFGLEYDNFIGNLAQTNTPTDTWAEFYATHRLEAQWRPLVNRGLIEGRMRTDFRSLLQRIEDRVGPQEPPSKLHGDLWGGNVISDAQGAPIVIDPAVYAGHREVDLAMMRLFGGFSEHTFIVYQETYPLEPGFKDRIALYQLYPLLVHANLFGPSYLEGVSRCLGAVC